MTRSMFAGRPKVLVSIVLKVKSGHGGQWRLFDAAGSLAGLILYVGCSKCVVRPRMAGGRAHT